MIEHYNEQNSFDATPKSLTARDMLKLAWFLKVTPTDISFLEIQTIRQKQHRLALSTMRALNIISYILVITLWLYIQVWGETHYNNIWFAIISTGYACLFVAWYINNADYKKSKINTRKFIFITLPGLCICAVSLGLIPTLLMHSFQSEYYIEQTVFVALLASAIAWGFPFFQLPFLMLTTICFTFSYASYALHPNKSFLTYGLIFIYNSALSCILYLCFNFFTRWVLHRIKYKQKSNLLSLFLKDFEENSTEWLWQTNQDGYINYVSVRLIEITGLHKDQLQKLTILDLFNKDQTETQQLEEIITQRKHFINFAIPIRIKEENKIWNLTGYPKYDYNGFFLGYRGVGSDITKINLLDAISEEKNRYESFSQVSGSLSHDFNNLLASISLRLELIRTSENISKTNKTYINEALDVCKKLAKITSQMLIYSRKEALEPKNFSIDFVLNTAIQEMKTNQGNCIDFIIAGENYYIWSDEALFYNALINVLNNAVRAMGKKGEIFITKKFVYVNKNELKLKHGDYVYISIEDTGPGFDKDALENAFKPFYTQYRYQGGSGLGLSMVQGFTKQSNGDIFLSNGEYGAKVEIYLPAGITMTNQTRSSSKKLEHKNYNILLVEDNKDFGLLLKKHLETNNFSITYVQTVAEAKETLDKDEHINVVLSDFLLPDGKGSEVVKYARLKNTNISALYISGFLDKPLDNELEKAPILRKPFTLSDLNKAIYEISLSNNSIEN